MSASLHLDMAGHAFELLPQRALWWPAERCLMVADVHLGKGAAFRALGQPVPRGSSAQTLALLDELLNRHAAERLVILGDWLHAPQGVVEGLQGAVRDWRERHRQLEIEWVAGNHDRDAAQWASEWGMTVWREERVLAPRLVAAHAPRHAVDVRDARKATVEPSAVASQRPMACESSGPPSSTDELTGSALICGHLHPVVALHARADGRLRLPCFLAHPRQLVLPAFGAFTGGWAVDVGQARAAGQRMAVVAQERIWWLPFHEPG